MHSGMEQGLDLVIKLGGATGISYGGFGGDLASVLSDSAAGGLKVVVVHGGSHEADTLGESLGKPPRFITSPSGHVSRRTDREAIDIMMMAVAGKVNKTIVECLQRCGLNAVGLSGMDGRLLLASRKTAVRCVENGKTMVLRDDLSGKLEEVNRSLVSMLVCAGYVPVVSPIAISPSGEPLNVDADRCAAAIAGAFRAERMIILSNVPGLMRDPSDPGTLVRFIPARSLAGFEQYATGKMKKKLVAAQEALEAGVREVVISDARVERPVRHAISGGGTVIG